MWIVLERKSETTGIKLGFSKGEVAEMDAIIEATWQRAVEEEANRRLAERGLTLEAHPYAGQVTCDNARLVAALLARKLLAYARTSRATDTRSFSFAVGDTSPIKLKLNSLFPGQKVVGLFSQL